MKQDAETVAVVLLSGGLDSATVLAMAVAEGLTCHALSIDYGQRHHYELEAAAQLAQRLGARSHRTAHVDLDAFGGSALTDKNIAVPHEPGNGIPVTYVPARNTVMLSLALAWAELLQAARIYIGVNAVDYSGYPDCRPEFIEQFQRLANVATKSTVEGQSVEICAPLIALSKAQIVHRGHALGLDYAATVSCYAADDKGRACGECEACRLRRNGFEEAGLPDPTRYCSSA